MGAFAPGRPDVLAFKIDAPLLVAMGWARVIRACLPIASPASTMAASCCSWRSCTSRRTCVAGPSFVRFYAVLADGHTSGIRSVECKSHEGHEPTRALYRSLGSR